MPDRPVRPHPLMVFLSLVLRPRVNRIVNIVVALVYAVSIIALCIGEAWVYYILRLLSALRSADLAAEAQLRAGLESLA